MRFPRATIIATVLIAANAQAQTDDSIEDLCAKFSDRFGTALPDFEQIDPNVAYAFENRLNDMNHKLRVVSAADPRISYFEYALVADSNRIHKLINSADRLKQAGVPKSTSVVYAKNSLMIKGTVLEIDDYSEQCLRFKITYKVRVDAVYWCDFDLKQGDVVLLKDIYPGYAGDCSTDVDDPMEYDLEVGKTDIFIADKGRYSRLLSMNRIDTYFQDKYCPNAFALTPHAQEKRIQIAEKAPIVRRFVP